MEKLFRQGEIPPFSAGYPDPATVFEVFGWQSGLGDGETDQARSPTNRVLAVIALKIFGVVDDIACPSQEMVSTAAEGKAPINLAQVQK